MTGVQTCALPILAGIGLAAAGGLLLRLRLAGVAVYALVFVGTVVWALWEVGLDSWGLVPRLVGPAILMALGVVREKELGSITNLYVTPVSRIEFLLGKQLPYVAVAMISFLTLVAQAVFVFGVPVKGSLVEKNLKHWQLVLEDGTPLAGADVFPADGVLLQWDVAGIADGAHTLTLTAEDKAGNLGTAKVDLVVDNTPPIVAIAKPTGDPSASNPQRRARLTLLLSYNFGER